MTKLCDMTEIEQNHLLKGERPEAYDHNWHSTRGELALHYRIWKNSGTMELYVLLDSPSGRYGGFDATEEPATYHHLVARWPADMPMTESYVPEIIRSWFYPHLNTMEASDFRDDALEAVMVEARDDDLAWMRHKAYLEEQRVKKFANALEYPENFNQPPEVPF